MKNDYKRAVNNNVMKERLLFNIDLIWISYKMCFI